MKVVPVFYGLEALSKDLAMQSKKSGWDQMRKLAEERQRKFNEMLQEAFDAQSDDCYLGDLDSVVYPCWHKWKSYVGFTEAYDYCEDCGEKRE